MQARAKLSKPHLVVSDGVFRAELNEFFKRELREDGYSGVEVRAAPTRFEVILRATKTHTVLGEGARRVRELTAVLQKRFGYGENEIDLFLEKMNNRGLCAVAQAESLRFKLVSGVVVRRACYAVLRQIMEAGAKGAEIIISGKLRGQRAKSMKFSEGLMIHSGHPTQEYIDRAVMDVNMKQGILGVKVKIMKAWDTQGKIGPTKSLPDTVTILAPKEEVLPDMPVSTNGGGAVPPQQAGQVQQVQANQQVNPQQQQQPMGAEQPQ